MAPLSNNVRDKPSRNYVVAEATLQALRVRRTDLQGGQRNLLLEAVRSIPGSNLDEGRDVDQLMGWIDTVREWCADLARVELADISLGKLLSHCSVGRDGIWPSELVREVMERLQSDEVIE